MLDIGEIDNYDILKVLTVAVVIAMVCLIMFVLPGYILRFGGWVLQIALMGNIALKIWV